MREYWDLYDAAGQFTGETLLRGEPIPAGRYHKVVHIWLQNGKGELLIQKRSDKVEWDPGVWAVTGGSVVAGEDELTSAVRELEEELGIKAAPEQMEFVLCIRHRGAFCYIYLVHTDVPVEKMILQESEVAAAEWLTVEETEKRMKEGTMHRYDYYEVFRKFLTR